MRISLDLPDSAYFVRSYEPGELVLNQTVFTKSVAVYGDTLIENLKLKSMDDFTAEIADKLVELKPKLVIIGTGEKQNFPDRAVLKSFINAQIGVEIMNTHAAARTYNILAQDGRDALGVFIV